MPVSFNSSTSTTTTTTTTATVGALSLVMAGGVYLWLKLKNNKKATSSRKKLSPSHAKRLVAQHVAEQMPLIADGIPITHLYIHPIKSCRGYQVRSARLFPRGLAYDREWLVIRKRDAKVMTIRELPAMRRVTARVVEDISEEDPSFLPQEVGKSLSSSATLVITYTSADASIAPRTLRLPFSCAPLSEGGEDNSTKEDVPISIWGLDGTVRDEGAEATAFFTAVLNEDMLLKKKQRQQGGGGGEADGKRTEGEEGEEGEAEEEEEVYFLGRTAAPRDPKVGNSNAPRVMDANLRIRGQDGSSLHILTEESIQWVGEVLPSSNTSSLSKSKPASSSDSTPSSLPMHTLAELYRPNILVKGVPFPQEDRWDTMRIVKASNTNATVESEKDNRGGGIALKTFHHCDRCAIPTTSLDGKRDKGFQPTRMLREQHSIRPSKAGDANKGLLGLNVNVRLLQKATSAAQPAPPSSSSAQPQSLIPKEEEPVDATGRTLRGSVEDDSTMLGLVSVGDFIEVTSFRDYPAYL